MISPVNFNSSSHFSSSSSKKTYQNTPSTNPDKTAEEVAKIILKQQTIKIAAKNLDVSMGSLGKYVAFARKICIKGNKDLSKFNCSRLILEKIVNKYWEIASKGHSIKPPESTQQTSKPDSQLGKRKLRDPSKDDSESNESKDKDDFFSLLRKEQDQSASSNSESNEDLFFLMSNDSIDPSQIPLPEPDPFGFYNYPNERTDNDTVPDELMSLASESYSNSISPSSFSESDSSLHPSPGVVDSLDDLSPSIDFGNDFSLIDEGEIQSENLGIYSKDLQEEESPDDLLLLLGANPIVPPQSPLPEEDELNFPIQPEDRINNDISSDERIDEPMPFPPQNNSVSSSPSSNVTIVDNSLPLSSNPSSSLPSLSAIVLSSSSTLKKHKKRSVESKANPSTELPPMVFVDSSVFSIQKKPESIPPESIPLENQDSSLSEKESSTNFSNFPTPILSYSDTEAFPAISAYNSRPLEDISQVAYSSISDTQLDPYTSMMLFPLSFASNQDISVGPKKSIEPKKKTIKGKKKNYQSEQKSKMIEDLANNSFKPIEHILDFTDSDLVSSYQQWKQKSITLAEPSDRSRQAKNFPLLLIDCLVEQSSKKRKILCNQYGFNKNSFDKYYRSLQDFINKEPNTYGFKMIISAAAKIIEESNKKNSVVTDSGTSSSSSSSSSSSVSPTTTTESADSIE